MKACVPTARSAKNKIPNTIVVILIYLISFYWGLPCPFYTYIIAQGVRFVKGFGKKN
jgi:hypothetical protein